MKLQVCSFSLLILSVLDSKDLLIEEEKGESRPKHRAIMAKRKDKVPLRPGYESQKQVSSPYIVSSNKGVNDISQTQSLGGKLIL